MHYFQKLDIANLCCKEEIRAYGCAMHSRLFNVFTHRIFMYLEIGTIDSANFDTCKVNTSFEFSEKLWMKTFNSALRLLLLQNVETY